MKSSRRNEKQTKEYIATGMGDRYQKHKERELEKKETKTKFVDDS